MFVEDDLKYLPVPREDFETILKIMNRSTHRDVINPSASLICDNVKDYTLSECNGVIGVAYLGRKHNRSIWLVKCLSCNKYSIQHSGSLENRIRYDHNKCNNCKRISHNESRSLLCKQWYRLRDKCLNEKAVCFKSVGANGITMCERWKTYSLFKEDMKPTYVDKMTLKLKPGKTIYNLENTYWELR